jgi:hypothetical protein
MFEGMYEDKIIKNNHKCEHTSLSEPADPQKESEKVTTIEEEKNYPKQF